MFNSSSSRIVASIRFIIPSFSDAFSSTFSAGLLRMRLAWGVSTSKLGSVAFLTVVFPRLLEGDFSKSFCSILEEAAVLLLRFVGVAGTVVLSRILRLGIARVSEV